MKIITRKEAKEQNLKFYFTGKPCKRGHIAQRTFPKSECVVCKKEHDIQYYKENRDERLIRQKQYYKDNRESRLTYMKEYQQENKDHISEYWKKWYRENS